VLSNRISRALDFREHGVLSSQKKKRAGEEKEKRVVPRQRSVRIDLKETTRKIVLDDDETKRKREFEFCTSKTPSKWSDHSTWMSFVFVFGVLRLVEAVVLLSPTPPGFRLPGAAAAISAVCFRRDGVSASQSRSGKGERDTTKKGR
jgi:hypothetical protein